MEFRKYQHVERFGTSETQGIEFGYCYVFPKIDGTNASVWIDNGEIQAGSRKRHLSLDNDNAGFLEWAKDQSNILSYLKENPAHRLFGEWLVPHSLKTYRPDAWRRFYVFDVTVDRADEGNVYIPFSIYESDLEKHEIEYISPLAIIKNPRYDQLIKQLEKNTFLINDGEGAGEGIVIKNYDFYNKFGRQVWAKIVTSEFKEKHIKVMGSPVVEGKKMIEQEIVQKYVTTALCEKVKSKIDLEENGFTSKHIPRLLNTVFYDLIKEESWDFVKEFKNPTINYTTLKHFAVERVKSCLPDVF